VLVAGGIIALTAVLVELPPARTSVDRPFSTTVREGDLRLQIDVQPATVGPNDMHLYFFDPSGTAVTIDAVEITVAFADVPARMVEVTPVTPSHVSAYGASLGQPGTWTVTVTAVRAGQPTVLNVEVPIR
jgi:copper transport protein